ncbi:NPCBM/NEW2 domain-containing protein [Deinococcus koreensis]|uniref:Glycosyl hydrolase family 98 putative carbohydrate-binding module domain-containing protein n=1 Tax=Deinococcus koreensis TaxID=2054903 RepID=A0A2K3UT24_9DEIO|nr:NPCBM/NEW2 domain-containing protein [Deinococcus koreensis]PNY79668.1 hypothetical protein CVO96_17030 [Deinococcus koreensis]
MNQDRRTDRHSISRLSRGGSGPFLALLLAACASSPAAPKALNVERSELSSGFLSDQLSAATTTVNGWGPLELDRSNGDDPGGDGERLSLAGVSFEKGLGTHANSDLGFAMGGNCTRLTARVGVDDSVRAGGKYDARGVSSVVFQVFADGHKLFDSGIMTARSSTRTVDVTLPAGARTLHLLVGDAGDGIGYDHADWADARVECGEGAQPPSPPAGSGKKLIQLGWDAPTPDFVRANIATMEQQPFDGLVVNLNAGKTIFNKTAYPDSAYVQDRADLAATRFASLRHNFISIWAAREANWSWFSDQDWAATQANARNFARTAKAGHFKGFFFDPEPYGTSPWSYSRSLYPDQDFAAVQAKVRQRGAAFLSTIQAEMPDVQMLTLFGMTYLKKQADQRGGLEQVEWGLLASFIEGMLDVIGPQARLIDGNEPSYYYYLPNAQEFSSFAGQRDAARTLVSPENRARYDAQVKTSHAVFVDGLLGLYNASGVNGLLGCHLRNTAERRLMLEHHLYQGLNTTDEYVWAYSEQMDWWGSLGQGVRLPDETRNIVARARQKVSAQQPLGFDVEPFLGVAAARYARTWNGEPTLGCL